MCRVRFRPDGIYLSLPYIERLEEPCYPLEEVYVQPPISTVPQALAEKQIAAKDSPKRINGIAKKKEVKTLGVVDDAPPSPSSSSSSSGSSGDDLSPTSSRTSLSSLSSHDDDSQEPAEQDRAFESRSKRLAVQSKRNKAKKQSTEASNPTSNTNQSKNESKNQVVRPSKGSKAESSGKQLRCPNNSSPGTSSSSPFKQVRFSDMVEERTILSDEGSDTSGSSDSSRDSNIDEKAHLMLQGNDEPQDAFSGYYVVRRCGLSPTGSPRSGSNKASGGRNETNLGENAEDRAGFRHYGNPRRPKALNVDEPAGGDGANLDTVEGSAPYDGDSEEDLFDEAKDIRRSRFHRQKALSPLLRSHALSTKGSKSPPQTIVQIPSKIGDMVKAGSKSKQDMRRSKDSSNGLRAEYRKEKIAPKSAMKGKEDYKPPYVGEGDAEIETLVDPETGMTWRDV